MIQRCRLGTSFGTSEIVQNRHWQSVANDFFRVAMPNYFLGMDDRLGAPIEVGALVKVDRYGRSYRWHPEFRRAYRKVAGQVATVVGCDASGGVHIALGVGGVLALESCILRVVGRAGDRLASFARRNWPSIR